MSQGSFRPKIWFLGQKVCSVAWGQTDTKVKTEDTLQGFRIFFKFSIDLSSRSGPTYIEDISGEAISEWNEDQNTMRAEFSVAAQCRTYLINTPCKTKTVTNSTNVFTPEPYISYNMFTFLPWNMSFVNLPGTGKCQWIFFSTCGIEADMQSWYLFSFKHEKK